MGTRGAFIHECREHGMTPGNSNGKRRSSVSNASGVFEKLKTNVFKAFDDVDMDTFFEVSEFMSWNDNLELELEFRIFKKKIMSPWTYQNYEKLPQRYQNSKFSKSFFSVEKWSKKIRG